MRPVEFLTACHAMERCFYMWAPILFVLHTHMRTYIQGANGMFHIMSLIWCFSTANALNTLIQTPQGYIQCILVSDTDCKHNFYLLTRKLTGGKDTHMHPGLNMVLHFLILMLMCHLSFDMIVNSATKNVYIYTHTIYIPYLKKTIWELLGFFLTKEATPLNTSRNTINLSKLAKFMTLCPIYPMIAVFPGARRRLFLKGGENLRKWL